MRYLTLGIAQVTVVYVVVGDGIDDETETGAGTDTALETGELTKTEQEGLCDGLATGTRTWTGASVIGFDCFAGALVTCVCTGDIVTFGLGAFEGSWSIVNVLVIPIPGVPFPSRLE